MLAYHHPSIDAKTGAASAPVVTDDELERLEDQYVVAAGLALDAGFRAVDSRSRMAICSVN